MLHLLFPLLPHRIGREKLSIFLPPQVWRFHDCTNARLREVHTGARICRARARVAFPSAIVNHCVPMLAAVERWRGCRLRWGVARLSWMHLMNRREQVAYWGGAVLIALFSSAIIVNTTLLQPENAFDGKGLVISAKKTERAQKVARRHAPRKRAPRALPVAATHVRVRVEEPARVARTKTASISRVSAPAGSPLIMRVQRRLKRLGYDPGPIDGRLGPSTRAAIRRFQRANNMPPTGEIEPGVMALLLP